MPVMMAPALKKPEWWWGVLSFPLARRGLELLTGVKQRPGLLGTAVGAWGSADTGACASRGASPKMRGRFPRPRLARDEECRY